MEKEKKFAFLLAHPVPVYSPLLTCVSIPAPHTPSPGTAASNPGHRCLYPRPPVLLRRVTAASTLGQRCFYGRPPLPLPPVTGTSTPRHRYL